MDVDSKISSFHRVEVDLNNGLGIPCDGCWNVGKGERTNLHTTGSLVRSHEGTFLGDDAVIQSLHSEGAISKIGKNHRFGSSSIVLVNDDTVEGDNIRIHGQQRAGRCTDTFQGNWSIRSEFDIALAGGDRHIRREWTWSDGFEYSLEADVFASLNIDW